LKSVVFLDLGDTLIEINPKVYQKWARAISSVSHSTIKVNDLRQAIKDEWASRNGEPLEWVNTEETEQQYWRAFYRAVLKRLNVPNPPQALLDLLAQDAADPKSFICFDDIEVLNMLREKGVKLGLISNAFPSARRILEYLHLSEWFDPLLLSCDLAWAKPDPRIYEYALECAQITPEQSLFIDDRLTFVKGAQKVDMDALLIDRGNSCQVEPGAKICGLGQLLTAV